jgi:hypothetical protein
VRSASRLKSTRPALAITGPALAQNAIWTGNCEVGRSIQPQFGSGVLADCFRHSLVLLLRLATYHTRSIRDAFGISIFITPTLNHPLRLRPSLDKAHLLSLGRLRLESNGTGRDGCGGELHASWCGGFVRCYGWRSKRSTPVRSIDHGRAERHQPCRVGRSSARRSSELTRRP